MAFFSDTFTDTDAVQLQSHTPDVGTSWTRLWGSNATIDWVIGSNEATPESDTGDGSIYTADATYPSADYHVQWTAVALPSTQTTRAMYVLLRVQDQDNMYAVRLAGGTNTCQLYKKVSGTWTPLGSAFNKPAAGSICKLEIIGSSLKYYDDTVETASATDTDITAAGKAGIGAGGGTELVASGDASHTIWHIDAYLVEDLGTGGVTVVLDTLVLAGSTPQLDAVPGSVAVALDTLALAGSTPQAAIDASVSVVLDTLVLSGSTPQLDVIPGAVSVLLDTLVLAGSTQALAVLGGSVVALGTLILSGTVPPASVSPGAVAVLLSTLVGSLTSPSLTVLPGGVTVALDTLALAGSTVPFAVTAEVFVLLDMLGLAASTPGLQVLTASNQTVTLTTLVLNGQAVALSVEGGEHGHAKRRLILTSGRIMTMTPGHH